MNIHEYQAKALLKSFGAPIAEGVLVRSLEEAADAAAKLPGPVWVVKAQIHAGGRGKGRFKERDAGDKGGVRIAISPDEVRLYVQQMLGKTLVTKQTGPVGKRVERIYVEDGAKIDRELYVSMLVDRANGRIAYIVSTEGGMDIEEVAHKTPEKIHTFHVDPAAGYKEYIGRNIAACLDLRKSQGMACIKLMGQLYKAFVDKDMSLLEVNPLVVLKDGSLRVLDAKVNFEDNALFRHKDDILPLKDESEEDEKEREAHKHDLSYVALDGNIGCMVNGAGLAMATMDIIKLYGGEPANFLDVGGGADAAKVTTAFKIITKDPNVKGILINIFGGIMKVDTIANGVIAAVKEVGLKVPLVVRLEGTNVKEGKAILNASGLDVIAADDLDDAAQKIVAAVGKARAA